MDTYMEQIDMQIAEIMAAWGDNPQQFMIEMNELVWEWFQRGLAVNSEKLITLANSVLESKQKILELLRVANPQE